VRLALGAEAGGMQRMIIRQGLTLVAIGLAIGIPISLLVGRTLQGLLVATSPTDPVALGGGVTVLVLVSGVAAWLPARRAAAVDPMEALRSD